jgi:hypothetical protein
MSRTTGRPRDTSSSKDPGSQQTQRQRFIETARALECDEDEAAFDEKLKRIAAAKRSTKAKPKNADRKKNP